MSVPPDVRKWLAPMIDRKVELGIPGYRVDRERVLSRMKEARRSDRRDRARRRAGLWAAAAALVLAGGWLARSRGAVANAMLDVLVSEGSAARVSGETRAEIAEKTHARILAAGDLETASDSKASIRSPDGLQIELGGQTRVALDNLQVQSRQLKLLRGRVRCAVPHQRSSAAFEVLTPDVTIVDVGTVFTVSVEGPARLTHVTVEEGEVVVRHASGEAHVRAPGSWSSPSTPATTPASTASAESAPNASAAPPSLGAAPSLRSQRSASRTNETLDDEAQLLRQGLAAERQGRFVEASAALSLLLRKYPNSSMAPDARAALQRVDARAHP